MAQEQKGELVRIRTAGGMPQWQLRWTFNGKDYEKSHAELFPHLDKTLRAVSEEAVPVGDSLVVFFRLEKMKLVALRVDDQRLVQEQERLEQEAQAEQTAKEKTERAEGVTCARPGEWTRNATPDQRHFHNPYNFVPAPECMPGENNALCHRAPLGHDRYHDGAWSGSLTVEITVKTPLIVPDTARKMTSGKGKDEHITLPLLTDGDPQKPRLPVTSFKGALRSAYEAITNSRMGVFRGHDEALGRRMGTNEGLAMVPARVTDDGFGIELFMGTASPNSDDEWRQSRPGANRQPPGNLMYAAWLPRYFRTDRRNDNGPHLDRERITYPGGVDPEHGDPVVCWLRKARKGGFAYWRVEELRKGHDLSALSQAAPQGRLGGSHQYTSDRPIRGWGYVSITGQNFSRKHDERVFFVPEGATPYAYPDKGEFKTWSGRWKRLIADYRAQAEEPKKRREGKPDWAYLGKDPGKTAFSRHIYADDAKELNPSCLCYALTSADGDITGLYPVMIARELGEAAPETFLPENIKLATDYQKLSPADRVFGWVGQGGRRQKGEKNAYRGQLRVRSLDYDGYEDGTSPITDFTKYDKKGLPLAILGEPKPHQARFYLACDKGGAPFKDGADRREAFYRKNGNYRLRGRKVYPHQRRTVELDGYWDGPDAFANPQREWPGKTATYREYVRAGKIRDNQNRSIEGWFNPGVKFRAVIDVVNLDPAELGALIWLLSLPEGHYLRLGLAKPLGFGSVRLDLVAVDLMDIKAIKADYRSLALNPADNSEHLRDRAVAVADDGCFIPAYRTAMLDMFPNPPSDREPLQKQKDAFEALPIIAAWKNAAKGFDDGAPVHYPRAGSNTRTTEDGENFKWFVESERKARDLPKRQFALDPLWAPAGLPFLEERERNSGGRGHGRQDRNQRGSPHRR